MRPTITVKDTQEVEPALRGRTFPVVREPINDSIYTIVEGPRGIYVAVKPWNIVREPRPKRWWQFWR